MNPNQRRQNQPSTARGVGERSEEIRYPVPPASAAAWRKYQSARVHNPGLVFERFVRDWGWYEQRGDKEAKQKAWKEIELIVSKGDARLLKEFNARWELDAQAIGAQPFTLNTDWRFITGLGRKGPLEAGFTFNRYGFPILPGSSVKGIARAYAALVENKTEDDADFVAIFGRAPKQGEPESAAQSGNAIFLDAIPTHVPELQLDIMNPHYPKYYQGDEFPTDWQNPSPVFFLTVAPNMEFCFAVGWRGAMNEKAIELRALAQAWLMKGLQELGAGAKTSAGYGYFGPPEKLPTPASLKPAMTAAQPQPANPVVPALPIIERRGEIIEIRTDRRGYGRVRDLEDKKEYRFDLSVIKGDTPGKKSPVIFELQGDRVVKVRKV
jgi:CRISPR-associated protein Cmr6